MRGRRRLATPDRLSRVLPFPTSVILHGRQVPVRVLEELGELDSRERISLERLLSDPEELDRRCRAAFLDPGVSSGDGSCGEGETELYVHHHQEQMALPSEVATGGVEPFVRAMTVCSIWVTTDDGKEFLHVDYTIDAERTQYVLSVALDDDGVVRSVRMES